MIANGTKLSGRYEILAPLGAGGMGEVYSARDLRLGRDIAIKIVPEALAQAPEALGRFEQEARVLAALSHPNLVTIHDFGTDAGITFAVMELLKGETLRDLLNRERPSWQKSIEVAVAILDGLAAAHSGGVIHRDLKPENIFLTETGEVKILDFGLARIEQSTLVREVESQTSAPTSPVHTEPGMVVGTVLYMSPEQLTGQTPDSRSDLFSFGMILHEMLSGVRPFAGRSHAEVIAAILKDDPVGLAELGEKSSPELAQVIARCLEKDPRNRFHSARDVSFTLKSILSGVVASFNSTKRPARPKKSGRRKAINSLAVLPFANASGDPNMDYLGDGITESIINNVSQIPKLRVMARSTVFRYKGKDIDPQQVGTELGVRGILTGRVVLAGDRLSVQAELVDVSDGSQCWGDQYRRKFSDIFTIEEEISREISAQLRLKLSGEEKKRFAKRHTANTDAYELYLKGRYHWSKRTADGLKKAIEYFDQAIVSDPNYALAYAGLSDCYNLASAYGIMPPGDSVPRAQQAAQQALGLDPLLPEGHEALAHAKMLFDWDWAGTEAGFKRAIELNPNFATAHQRYAIFLAALGRLKQAEAEVARAHELDPMSLIINTDVGLIQQFQGRIDRALECYQKALDLDPNFAVAHYCAGLAYQQQGLHDRALASFEKGIQLSGERTVISARANILAVAGKHDEARQILRELETVSQERYVSPYRIALVYAGLGDTDRAFEWLEKAYQERSVWLIHVHLRVDPRLTTLHKDPRFTQLLQKMGMPPVPVP